MSRREVDLWRLPAWLRYAISLSLVGVIAGAGWYVGRNRPVPEWITRGLIPFLGWLVLGLAAIALVQWLRGKP
jgi:hypothetical protein